jgi:hypothetical protein
MDETQTFFIRAPAMLRLDGRGKRHVRLLYVNIRHHPPTTTVVIVVIIVIIIIVITTGTSVANTVDITAISAARSSYYLICIIQSRMWTQSLH